MDSSSSPAFAVAPPRQQQQQCVRQADEQHQKRLQICGPAARPPGVGTPTEEEGGRPGLTAANSRFIPNQARSSLFAPSFHPSPRQVMLNKSNALQAVRVSQQEMDPASSPAKAAETRGSPEDGSSGEKGASAERAVSEPFGRRCSTNCKLKHYPSAGYILTHSLRLVPSLCSLPLAIAKRC